MKSMTWWSKAHISFVYNFFVQLFCANFSQWEEDDEIDILAFNYDDYDKDCAYEAFAFIEKKQPVNTMMNLRYIWESFGL